MLKNLLAQAGIANAKLIDIAGAAQYITRPEKLAGFNSALVFTVPYPFDSDESGNICQYARGRDYHRAIPEYLSGVIEKFAKQFPSAKTAVFTDNSPFAEVPLAAAAGLGIRGRNNLLITSDHGTLVFIAEIVTDIVFPQYDPLIGSDSCSGCGHCVTACKSGALSDTGFDKTRCVSFLTQKKGELSSGEQHILQQSGSIWGCDDCQRSCPENRLPQTSPVAAFSSCRIPSLSLSNIEGLTEKEFQNKYGDYAFAWRGRNTLIRNLHIIKGD